MNVLVWFKRDLRVTDHSPLAQAAAMGRVLPLYVVEPDYWALPDTSARQWEFTAECLADLRAALSALGAPLIVRQGDAVDIIARLCRDHRIRHILSHEETGNQWTYARDLRLHAWARASAVRWEELPQSAVTRRLRTRDGWAARRESFVTHPPADTPAAITPIPTIAPGPIPSAQSLRLAPDRCPHRQRGGREVGLSLLDSFLTARGRSYRRAMSSPVTGERACARISAHLALGALSIREAAQATAARQQERPGADWAASLTSFQARLAWRDHFMQKLEDQPSIEHAPLDRATDALHRTPDATRLAAWEAGETGVPFVDACMRYLAATGWLNFRMRAMVTSFASYHLWLDWRASGNVLARRFTDYEPGIHWPQVQMQSGTTAINTIRIYNPVKQGQDQDPTGAFTRRWLPELADVPDTHLQTPWTWPDAQRLAYPEPVVDPAAAQRAARDALWALRRAPGHAETAAAIVTRHASRKGDTRFVNDRDPAPRRRKPRPPTAQLSLDL